MADIAAYHAQLLVEQINVTSMIAAIQQCYSSFESEDSRDLLDKHYALMQKNAAKLAVMIEDVRLAWMENSGPYANTSELECQRLIDESKERIFNLNRARARLIAGVDDAEYKYAIQNSLIGDLKQAALTTTGVFGLPIVVIAILAVVAILVIKKV